MKVNLLMNSGDVLSGYTNVDPLNFAPNKTFAPLDNLDKVVFTGEAKEIRANGILQYYSVAAGRKLMAHWASKLEHNGTLSITVPNGNELLRNYISGKNTNDELNTQLFGPQEYPWQTFRSLWTMSELVAVTKSLGLILLSANISPNELFIEVRRK